MQNHCDLWYEINDEHCKRWKRGFDKQPAGMIIHGTALPGRLTIVWIYFRRAPAAKSLEVISVLRLSNRYVQYMGEKQQIQQFPKPWVLPVVFKRFKYCYWPSTGILPCWYWLAQFGETKNSNTAGSRTVLAGLMDSKSPLRQCATQGAVVDDHYLWTARTWTIQPVRAAWTAMFF